MEKEIYEKIASSIEQNISRPNKYAKAKDHIPVPFERKNFHQIKEKPITGKIAFVDGSNNTIISCPGFSLSMIRTVAVIYQNNKRQKVESKEFYSLTSFQEDCFITDLFPKQSFGIGKINSDDETLRTGIEQVSIQSISGFVRRIAEIEMAKDCETETVVLDGTLEPKMTHEKEAIGTLYKTGKTVCALSKTTEMRTDSGASASFAVMQISPSGRWYYHPLFENENMMMIRLSQKSQYCFKFEINRLENADEVLSMLCANSEDPLFLGYPFGLAQAHQFCKIGMAEIGQHKMMFASRAGSLYKRIEEHMRAMNAHDQLDLM